jgi:hypothetical protein
MKKRTLLALAERGTNETGIAAEQKIMIETAMRAYDNSLPSLESVFGEPEETGALPEAAVAEGLWVTQPKKNKYISELDAGPERLLHMGGKYESGG